MEKTTCWPECFTLVDKVKRKIKILLCKMPVFNFIFEQHYIRNSVKFLIDREQMFRASISESINIWSKDLLM